MLQIKDGVGDSMVKCGVVYIGCSWPLHATEEKALRAAAAIQLSQGTPHTLVCNENALFL